MNKWVVYFFVLSSSLFLSQSTQANDDVKVFDLPAQALSNSLLEFALQADISLYLQPSHLQGKRSPSIVGPYNIDYALERLLSRSDLTYQHNPLTDAYQIKLKKLKEYTEVNRSPETETPPLEEIVVTAQSYPNRYHTLQHSFEHSGVSSFDSIRVHSTLTQKLIDDQNVSEVRDVLHFSSGITLGDGYGDTNDDFYIRGFPRHSIYLDSYRLESSTGIRFLSDHIQQIEILKGPSSLYYGQGQPGGVVNLIRKKPVSKKFLFADQTFGDRIIKTTVDLNNQWAEALNYRSILSYTESEPNKKLKDLQQTLLYQNVAFDWSKLKVNISFEWQQEKLQKIKDEQALSAYLNLFPGATLDELLHQKNNNYKADFFISSLNLHSTLNHNWLIKASVHWQEESRDGVRTNIDQARFSSLLIKPEEIGYDYFLLMPGGEMAIPIVIVNGHLPEANWRYRLAPLRTIYDEESFETGVFGSMDLEGSFKFSGFTHHLSLGIDGKRQDTYQAIIVEVREPFAGVTWSSEEFAQQLPNIAQQALFDVPLGRLEEQQERRVYDEFGAYLRNTMELGENTHLSAGLRYTRALAEFEDIKTNQYEYPDIVSNFSTQFGISHSVSEQLSLFANYSESLRANYFQYMSAPGDLEPEEGEQIELGAKINALANKLLASFALYQIEKQNIYSKSLQFFIDAQNRSQRPLHNQETQGVDIDISMELNSDTQIMLAGALMNSRISIGEFKNNTPALVAEKTASLLLRHEITSNFAAQFSLQYVGERFGDESNQITLDEYQIVNLGLSYFPVFLPKSEWHISVKNLFDEDYYSTMVAGARINYGSPKSAYLTLKYQLF